MRWRRTVKHRLVSLDLTVYTACQIFAINAYTLGYEYGSDMLER